MIWLIFYKLSGNNRYGQNRLESVKNNFKKPLPHSSMQLDEVYDEFKQNILPYYLGNIHPRYWSWVMGTGTAQAMLAEMLAAGMNCNVGIGDQAPMYVDQQVIDWCKQMMGFPAESSGAISEQCIRSKSECIDCCKEFCKQFNQKIRDQ